MISLVVFLIKHCCYHRMKWLPLCLYFGLQVFTVSAQRRIDYGNNLSAGKFYHVRGMKMYVEEYGSGKPVLLIHGNNGNMGAFGNNIPYFSRKYRVIATDSRAQGRTVDTNDSLTFEMMADDEAALMDQLNIDSAYVIGFSDGGIVALLMAMRHPEKVIKLASTGANLWPDSTAINPSLWISDKAYYDSSKIKKFITPEDKHDWKLFLLDWFQPNITLAQMEKIKCPALIIGGDHDLIRVEHTAQIFQHIPKASLWIVPDSGHGTLMEHSDEFNKKVDEFFTKPYHPR